MRSIPIVGFVRVAIHVLAGVATLALFFPFALEAKRAQVIRWWSGKLLTICSVEVRLVGSEKAASAAPSALGRTMLVMNHISWIDIFAVLAVEPARFVGKSEIRSWPLLGYLCARSGTIFIERGRRHAVHTALGVVSDALGKGALVAIFPEGTTTVGDTVLPFHSNLMQAAVDAGVPVRPGAIRYTKRNASGEERRTEGAAYVGETSMFESLTSILRNAPMVVELQLLAPVQTSGRTRHQVAREARAAIALALHIDIDGLSPGADTAGIRPETAPGLPGAPR